MKTILIAAVFLFALGAGSALAASLTRLERQRLVAHLEMTESWLVDEVSGLSPAQLQFRPAPGAWSIMEVVEHLVVAEPIYWQDLRKAMKAPPSSQKRSGTDADILWYGIDRTQRQKAIAAEEPKGQLRDLEPGWMPSASCMRRCSNTPGPPMTISAATLWKGREATRISGCC